MHVISGGQAEQQQQQQQHLAAADPRAAAPVPRLELNVGSLPSTHDQLQQLQQQQQLLLQHLATNHNSLLQNAAAAVGAQEQRQQQATQRQVQQKKPQQQHIQQQQQQQQQQLLQQQPQLLYETLMRVQRLLGAAPPAPQAASAAAASTAQQQTPKQQMAAAKATAAGLAEETGRLQEAQVDMLQQRIQEVERTKHTSDVQQQQQQQHLQQQLLALQQRQQQAQQLPMLQREGEAVQHLLDCIQVLRHQQQPLVPIERNTAGSDAAPPAAAAPATTVGEASNLSLQQRLVNFLSQQQRQQGRLLQIVLQHRQQQEQLASDSQQQQKQKQGTDSPQQQRAKLLNRIVKLLQQQREGSVEREGSHLQQQQQFAEGPAAAAGPLQRGVGAPSRRGCGGRGGGRQDDGAKEDASSSLELEATSAAVAAAALHQEQPDAAATAALTRHALSVLKPLLQASFQLPHFPLQPAAAAGPTAAKEGAAAAAAAAATAAEGGNGTGRWSPLGATLAVCLQSEAEETLEDPPTIGLGIGEWQRDSGFLFCELARLLRSTVGLPPDPLLECLLRSDSQQPQQQQDEQATPQPQPNAAAANEGEPKQGATEETDGAAAAAAAAADYIDAAAAFDAAAFDGEVFGTTQREAKQEQDAAADASAAAPLDTRDLAGTQTAETPCQSFDKEVTGDSGAAVAASSEEVLAAVSAAARPVECRQEKDDPNFQRDASKETVDTSSHSPHEAAPQQQHLLQLLLLQGETPVQQQPLSVPYVDASGAAASEGLAAVLAEAVAVSTAVSRPETAKVAAAEAAAVAEFARDIRNEIANQEALKEATTGGIDIRLLPMEFSACLSSICAKALQQCEGQQLLLSPSVQCCWDRIYSICQPLWQQLADTETSAAESSGPEAAASVAAGAAGDTGEKESFCVICRLLQQQTTGSSNSSSAAAAGGMFQEAFDMLRQHHRHVYLPAHRGPQPVLDEYAQGHRARSRVGGSCQKGHRDTPPSSADGQQQPQLPSEWRRHLLLPGEAGAFDVRDSSSVELGEDTSDDVSLWVSSGRERVLAAAAAVGREEREALAQQFLLQVYGRETLNFVEKRIAPHPSIFFSSGAWHFQMPHTSSPAGQQAQQQEICNNRAAEEVKSLPALRDSSSAASGSGSSSSLDTWKTESPSSRSFCVKVYGHYTACSLALDSLQQQRQQNQEKQSQELQQEAASSKQQVVLFSTVLLRRMEALEKEWFARLWGPLVEDCEASPPKPSSSSSSRVMTLSAHAIKDVTEDCWGWVRRRLLLPHSPRGPERGAQGINTNPTAGAPEGPVEGPPCSSLSACVCQSETVGLYNRRRQMLLLDVPPWTDPKKHAASRSGTEERANAPGYSLRHRRRCPPSPNSGVVRSASGEGTQQSYRFPYSQP